MSRRLKYLLYCFRFSSPQKLWFEDRIFRFLCSIGQVDSGKIFGHWGARNFQLRRVCYFLEVVDSEFWPAIGYFEWKSIKLHGVLATTCHVFYVI